MPKVTVRNSRYECAGRIREIAAAGRKIRVKLNISFYDPDLQRYQLLKGDSVTMDTGSVLFVLSLADKIRGWIGGLEK
jgi:hypothetical protein